jgi:glucans biosynthesis protein C
MRAWSNLIRCAIHTGVPFMVTRTGMWPLKESNNDNLLPDVLMFIGHGCIMEIFFFLSGFLSAQLLRKMSWQQFALNRLRKIGIPFAVGMCTLVPFVLMLFPIGAALEQGVFRWDWAGWWAAGWHRWQQNLFVLGHLWFLYYLILFNVVVVVCKWTNLRPVLPPLRLTGYQLFGGLLFLAMAAIWASRAWYVLNPLTTRVEWNSLIYFGSFYGLGMLLANEASLLPYFQHNKRLWLITFIAFSLVAPVFQPFANQPEHPYHAWLHVGAIVSTAVHSISGVFAAIGWWQADTRPISMTMQRISRASYWVYLVHLPIVMCFHLALYPLQWPLWVKYVVAFTGSFALAFSSRKILKWRKIKLF